MSTDANLRERLEGHLRELPVLPSVVVKLLRLNRDDEDYPDEVIATVESEPNFSTQVMAVANSAASSPLAPITTISAAVTRIGADYAANLVVSSGVTRVFVPRDSWDRSLWRHALQVASAAKAVCGHLTGERVNPDEAYTAGLLHDVGRFVMFQEAPERLRQIDEGNWEGPEDLTEMEKSICGVNHAELGAIACEQWGIPDLIGQVVLHHHDRNLPPDALLTSVVRFADLAMFPSARPDRSGYAEAEEETVWEELHTRIPPNVNLDAHQLHALIQDVTERTERISQALGIG
ncbi:MAG: HDOD domain-containing protein [Acidobacteriota bacterium]|nr:HDOD domain-containing protein [Acidobacteriota bacterium]